jgi:hypothetical protein
LQMVNLIKGRVQGVVVAHLIKIEIFQSDVTGAYQNAVEDSFHFVGTGIDLVTWPVDLRNDSLIDADYLGVRITYNYTYLTAFISGGNSTLTLTATSVQRIEPQNFQGHRSLPGVVLSSAAQGPSVTASGPGAGDGAQPAVVVADTRRRRTTGGAL